MVHRCATLHLMLLIDFINALRIPLTLSTIVRSAGLMCELHGSMAEMLHSVWITISGELANHCSGDNVEMLCNKGYCPKWLDRPPSILLYTISPSPLLLPHLLFLLHWRHPKCKPKCIWMVWESHSLISPVLSTPFYLFYWVRSCGWWVLMTQWSHGLLTSWQEGHSLSIWAVSCLMWWSVGSSTENCAFSLRFTLYTTDFQHNSESCQLQKCSDD